MHEEQDVVKQIPLEPRTRSPSPATRMREFELSHENRPFFASECSGNISPTMVQAKVSQCIMKLEAKLQKSEQADLQERNVDEKPESVKNDDPSPTSDSDSLDSSSAARPSDPPDEPLIPPNFFENVQPSTSMLPVNSISDLLLAIHTHSHPSEIAMVVSEYTEKNILTAEEEQMIEKAVRQKVMYERKRRGEIVDDEKSPVSSSAKRNREVKESKGSDGDKEFELRSSDFNECGGKPSSFVGVVETNQLKYRKNCPNPFKKGVTERILASLRLHALFYCAVTEPIDSQNQGERPCDVVANPPKFPATSEPLAHPAVTAQPATTLTISPSPPLPPPPPPPAPPPLPLLPSIPELSQSISPVSFFQPPPSVTSNPYFITPYVAGSSVAPLLSSTPTAVTFANSNIAFVGGSAGGPVTAGEMDMDISDDEQAEAVRKTMVEIFSH
ncbi:unnamed protein product [Gongylonema pulchrum]|uniref:Pollen-specific leucine-rich repeat extensin-like protein 2 n=1 Tax=Gongylonema pulchrum TaxID=637853 RepID=A0A183E8H9_9BILA|nr:unnamed protein product [Gongylonema pulchrum]